MSVELYAANYDGLGELEYELDPRDGRYMLLDVNARTWGYHSLGAAAGVDFSNILYRDQLGCPPSLQHAEPGIAWIRTVTDLPAAASAILAADTGLREYLSSLWSCHTEAVFSTDDVWPSFFEQVFVPYVAVKTGF